MTYRSDKAQGLKSMSKAQRTLVQYTGRNLLARDVTRVRLHDESFIGSSIHPPATPTPEWLHKRKLEDSYYDVNDEGHQLSVRQYWANAIVEEAESITVGANETIEWFLIGLAEWLMKHLPGYYVVVLHEVTEINGRVALKSLKFLVTKTKPKR